MSERSETADANVKKEEEDVKEEVISGVEQAKAKYKSQDSANEPKEEEESDGEYAAIANAGERKCKKELPQVDLDQLYSEPSFSVICSFFNKFGAMLGVKPCSFSKLEQLFTKFDDNGRVDRELIELNMALLRRINYKSVRWDCWEKYLGKFCELRTDLESEFVQMERFGYTNLPVASKIVIMKALCEAQFDYNIKFKENIVLSSKSSDLRLLPVGSDCAGLAYWYQQDSDLSVRVYTEEQDDKSGGTWKLIASSSDELQTLIDKLKERDLGYVKKEKDKKTDEKGDGEKIEEDMVITTKKGTFLDTFQDTETVKKMREALEKKKEQRRNKGGNGDISIGTPEPATVKKAIQEELEVDKKEVKKAEEDEDSMDIPDDLKQFMDRRILPRRSARASAISNIRSFASPQKRKPTEKKDKTKKKEDKADESANSESEEEESGEEEEDEEEEEEEEEIESADEFLPSSEKRKKSGKRRRRVHNPENGEEPKRKRRKKKRKIDFDDMEEEDEDGEEIVQKERKKANEDSTCKKCKKTDHWEVLLLCDECDDAWHTWCLTPQLWFVPDDDWFCPKCTHGMLIEKLCRVMDALGAQMKMKEVEDKKKKAAADRLRREMEYIGVSLNNIIPPSHSGAIPSSSSEDEDDGQRRSKKKAVKRLNPDRYYRERQPLVTIAEGRSKRRVTKVDYNFSQYDEMLKEAMEIEEGEPRVSRTEAADTRPQGGAGRGKDMRNILEADEKRRTSVDEGDEVEGESSSRMVSRPAFSEASKKKQKRRLNDLNSDEEEESEQSEYEEKDAAEEEAAAEADPASGSDYVPSDEGRRRGRRVRSDDDFLDDGSDDDDWDGSSKKRGRVEKKPIKRGGRKKWDSDDDTASEYSDSDCSWKKGSKKKKKAAKRGRWDPPESSEEEEEEELEEKHTASGRPLRRAVVKAERKRAVIESDEEDEEEDEGEEGGKKKEEEGKKKEQSKEKDDEEGRPSTARHPLSKKGREKKKTEEDEFKPEESEDEEEADEDEEEEEGEEEEDVEVEAEEEEENDDEEVEDEDEDYEENEARLKEKDKKKLEEEKKEKEKAKKEENKKTPEKRKSDDVSTKKGESPSKRPSAVGAPPTKEKAESEETKSLLKVPGSSPKAAPSSAPAAPAAPPPPQKMLNPYAAVPPRGAPVPNPYGAGGYVPPAPGGAPHGFYGPPGGPPRHGYYAGGGPPPPAPPAGWPPLPPPHMMHGAPPPSHIMNPYGAPPPPQQQKAVPSPRQPEDSGLGGALASAMDYQRL